MLNTAMWQSGGSSPTATSEGHVGQPTGCCCGHARQAPSSDRFAEGNITVRLVDSADRRSDARLLINKMYSWRGYGDNHVIPITPNHITFTAAACCETVGTITLAVDSPTGLAVDTLFKDDIDAIRREPGAKVCELTKLAFDSAAPSKPLLASFFHIVFIYGYRQHQCTDLFIEVNPRHCRFYESMLGFERLGEIRMNESVGAPSVLMRLKVAEIREKIDRLAAAAQAKPGRSLYHYFFSPREEDGIFGRLKDVGETPIVPALESRAAQMIAAMPNAIAC